MLNFISPANARASLLLLTLCSLCAITNPLLATEAVTIKSPDGKVSVVVQPGERLSYSAKFNGKTVVESSAMGITLSERSMFVMSNATTGHGRSCL